MRNHPRQRALAVIFAAGLLLTACGGGRGETATTSPGITDNQVTFGTSYPLSGPASAYATIDKGMKACLKKANAEGGVEMGDGKTRKIKLITYDDGYQPPRQLENARRLIEKDRVFGLVGTLGTPTNSAIVDYVNEKKVPHVFLATGASLWGSHTDKWPWTIGWQPAYSLEAAIYAEYLKRNKPDSKVAVLYQNDDFGKDYLNGFKEAIKGSGIEIVAQESYQTTDPTVNSQVVNLARSNADVFLNITTPKFAAQAIAKKAQTGWDPLHILTNVSASVESVLKPAGLEASKGIVTAQYLKEPSDPRWDDDKAMQDYFAAAKKYGNFNPIDPFGTFGFGICNSLIHVLEETEQPTRDAFMKAVRNMDHRNPYVLPGVPVKTGSGDGFPIESEQLTRFDGERWVPTSEVINYEGETPVREE